MRSCSRCVFALLLFAARASRADEPPPAAPAPATTTPTATPTPATTTPTATPVPATAAPTATPAPATLPVQIELPPDEQPKRIIPKPDAIGLPRESDVAVPLSGKTSTASTAIGGYAELT